MVVITDTKVQLDQCWCLVNNQGPCFAFKSSCSVSPSLVAVMIIVANFNETRFND